MQKKGTMSLAKKMTVGKPPLSGAVPNRQTRASVPTEQEVEEGLARMRPEVRKAYKKSLKEYGGVYKRLADM